MWFLFWVLVWVCGSIYTKSRLEDLKSLGEFELFDHSIEDDKEFINFTAALWPLMTVLFILWYFLSVLQKGIDLLDMWYTDRKGNK